MEQNSLNKNSVVSFIFNEETRNWQIINGGGVTGKISTSEETGRERLLEYCLRFPPLNLIKNGQGILLKHKNHIVGKVEYLNKKQDNNVFLLQFLYDILSVIQKRKTHFLIAPVVVPEFYQQEDGIKMTILEYAVLLNNVFGKNNYLSDDEQEFFLKTFKDYKIYKEFLDTKLILKK